MTLARIRRGLGISGEAAETREVGVGEEREYEAVAKGFGERSEAAGEGGKRKELGGLGMDETLRYAERGVRRLVKGLPREEEV